MQRVRLKEKKEEHFMHFLSTQTLIGILHPLEFIRLHG